MIKFDKAMANPASCFSRCNMGRIRGHLGSLHVALHQLMASVTSLGLERKVASHAMAVLRPSPCSPVAAGFGLMVAPVAIIGSVANRAVVAVDPGGDSMTPSAPEAGMVLRHLVLVAARTCLVGVALRTAVLVWRHYLGPDRLAVSFLPAHIMGRGLPCLVDLLVAGITLSAYFILCMAFNAVVFGISKPGGNTGALLDPGMALFA